MDLPTASCRPTGTGLSNLHLTVHDGDDDDDLSLECDVFEMQLEVCAQYIYTKGVCFLNSTETVVSNWHI
jgi:hypothetical protein